ncbi:MAG: FABP family protein [Actinomycetales bacterium]|nr:MAG: FABP family protein [Actinomycetales bacterium]
MTDLELPDGLNPKLAALGWLCGTWEGTGNGKHPTGEEFQFEQKIEFGHNGNDYLFYASQTFLLDENGAAEVPFDMESGFWRPQKDASLDVVISHCSGWSEVWTGKIQLTRIDLNTDAVMRTANAAQQYAAGQRLYGQVEGDLMYAIDIATADSALSPYMWARLTKTS